MISRLTGIISHTDLKYVILDVGGIGYKVHVTSDIAHRLGSASEKMPSPVTLWTYLAVRENALDLYGFISARELSFFELLITISGIGPKTAIGILNTASVDALDTAIRSGDTTHLVKIAGLGKKMAEKIVMELHDKVDTIGGGTAKLGSEMKSDADALEALKSLGYNHSEAREALREIDPKIKDTGAKVKQALKILGK